MDERTTDWQTSWRNEPLLGFVEHREDVILPDHPDHPIFTALLDVIREADVLRGGDDVQHMPTAQVFVAARGDLARRAFAEVVEASWVGVRVGSGPFRGSVYRDLDAAESFDDAVDVFHVAPELRAGAERVASLDRIPEATATELGSILQPGGGDFVAVYQVGQGNANAYCSRKGAPVTYFDFGGGCSQNAGTYPSGLRFCFTYNPPVILSHWDFDHWYSATRHPQIAASMWLAPLQPVGVRSKKFALSLAELRRWPDALPWMVSGDCAVVRCTGNSKNDSGLAVFFRVGDGDAVLCPGDAQFDAIPVPPGPRGAPLVGLVATHHGAARAGSPIPRPAPGAAIAFSYGTGNSYNHPAASARALYQSEGWTVQLDTPAGHVALGGPPRSVPCGGRCTLRTVQP